MMSSCHPTRRGLNYIAANSITLSRGAADAGACGFFLSAMRAVVRFSAPRFVRQLIYFTQREIVSRKHKARSALGIDTPKIPFRS
jgi:hypothetical protein